VPEKDRVSLREHLEFLPDQVSTLLINTYILINKYKQYLGPEKCSLRVIYELYCTVYSSDKGDCAEAGLRYFEKKFEAQEPKKQSYINQAGGDPSHPLFLW